MRALVVSPQFPQDFARSVYGGFQRLQMWLHAMQSVTSELDILFFPSAGTPDGPEAAAAVARALAERWDVHARVTLCARERDEVPRSGLAGFLAEYVRPALRSSRHTLFRSYLGSRQKQALERCLAKSPDFVFFHRLQTMRAAMSTALNGARIFLDLDDVVYRCFAREVRQPPRWRLKPLLYLQVPGLWWREREAIKRCTRAFVCSEADRQLLRRGMGVRNVAVIPNAVPRIAERALTTQPNVLYIGAYSYEPNVVAAEYLIREVWPLLQRLSPEARLLIAGPGAEAIPSFQERPPGVEFLGFAPDLGRLYEQTRVVCCPIQSGGGTRIKILEAASYGVPVVATTIGAEGIDLVPQREILIRDQPLELAQACAELLADDGRATRVGAAARKRVRRVYDRQAVQREMAALLRAG
jgi:glycosyltransferase involved in cell wall biosynthesis